MAYPILPGTVAVLFIGALIAGVVAAMSASNKQPGNLRRAVISLAVFSSLCMLVTSVYWIPDAFLHKPAAVAYKAPPVQMQMPSQASFPVRH